MIASTPKSNTGIFAFISILVFRILNRKVLFINRRNNRNFKKNTLLFKKTAKFMGKLLQITNNWNAKFSEYF